MFERSSVNKTVKFKLFVVIEMGGDFRPEEGVVESHVKKEMKSKTVHTKGKTVHKRVQP